MIFICPDCKKKTEETNIETFAHKTWGCPECQQVFHNLIDMQCLASEHEIKEAILEVLKEVNATKSTMNIWRELRHITGFHHIKLSLEQLRKKGKVHKYKFNQVSFWSLNQK